MVLVVEDNLELGTFLQDALKQFSLKSQLVSRHTDASFKLDNQQFKFVLMDLNLEKGTKSESILGAIRSDINHLNYNTPVIIISGEFDELRVHKLKGLIQGFVVKPFTIEDLLDKLQALKLI